MVVFVCSGCNKSLKKAQVEAHGNTCSKFGSVSCIDCSKEFWGEEFKGHLACITENEKYGGKNAKHKASTGATKQEEWTKKVQEIIENIKENNPRVASILQQLKNCNNTPRKKIKFMNFIKHSLKVQNEELVEEVWNLFSEATQKLGNSAEYENGTTNKEKTEENKKKKKRKKSKKESVEDITEPNPTGEKKKRKIDEFSGTNESESGESPKKKRKKNKKKKENATEEGLPNKETDSKTDPISEAILEVLRRTSSHEITLQKFRAKVSKLVSKNSEGKPKGNLISKINKRLRKMSNVKIENEQIQLISN